MGDSVKRVASLAGPASVAFLEEVSILLTAFFLLGRLEIGSRDIVRGFGGSMGPISTVSTRETFRSQLDVAVIDVGRVMVELIM
jgi:hypothetical protein